MIVAQQLSKTKLLARKNVTGNLLQAVNSNQGGRNSGRISRISGFNATVAAVRKFHQHLRVL